MSSLPSPPFSFYNTQDNKPREDKLDRQLLMGWVYVCLRSSIDILIKIYGLVIHLLRYLYCSIITARLTVTGNKKENRNTKE